MLRSAECSRVLTRGIKSYREGDLADARAALDEVLAVKYVGRESESQRTHRSSVRLIAVTLRAEVAAKQGDKAVARASIEEGFALWREAQEHPVGIGIRSSEAWESWEKWARKWLEDARAGA